MRFTVGNTNAPTVQAANVFGGIQVGSQGPADSRYSELVRELAPRDSLHGRQGEIADLTTFCLADDVESPYQIWQGPAWAGKTALLSWFVLNPPPGVRIVSFFVTSRYAGHDNRDGFLQVVLEQLATVLDRPLPPISWPHTLQADFRGMLSDAARELAKVGTRLVLVVDGLDEDQGATTDPGAHSIAALLPGEPSDGLRVVVSTRPNPSPPRDVPDHHPLVSASRRVVLLAPSPEAQVIRVDMEREVERLVDGSARERELLSLLTVARTGLTVSDLVELTGWLRRATTRLLNSVTGRTFMPRSTRANGETAFVLGHKDLQDTAEGFLDPTVTVDVVERFHQWANRYRVAQWPDNTPHYLMDGYAGLLQRTNDIDRLVALATDRARHEWMSLIGAATLALTEVIQVQNVLGPTGDDLVRMARLSLHAEYLAERWPRFPPELPGLWVAAGHRDRAEALMVSFATVRDQAEALLGMIGVDLEESTVTEVISLCARSLSPFDQAEVLSTLGEVLVRTGQVRRAAEAIAGIDQAALRLPAVLAVLRHVVLSGDKELMDYLVELAGPDDGRTAAEAVVVGAEDPHLAVSMCDGIESDFLHATALVSVAGVLAMSEARHQVLGVVVGALRVVANHQSPEVTAEVVLRAIEVVQKVESRAIVGHLINTLLDHLDSTRARPMRAATIVRLLDTVIEPLTDGELARVQVLIADIKAAGTPDKEFVRLVAQLQSVEAALATVSSMSSPWDRIDGLLAVARQCCRSSDLERAVHLLDTVQREVLAAAEPVQWSGVLTSVLEAIAAQSMPTADDRVVHDEHEPQEPMPWLVQVISSGLRDGNLGAVEAALWELVPLARFLGRRLVQLAEDLADFGQYQWIDRLVADIPPEEAARVRVAILYRLVEKGDHDGYAHQFLADTYTLCVGKDGDREFSIVNDGVIADVAIAASEISVPTALRFASRLRATATHVDVILQIVTNIVDRLRDIDLADLQAEVEQLICRAGTGDNVLLLRVHLHCLIGEAGAGERMADLIESSTIQAKAMVALMQAAHRVGDVGRANHLFERVKTISYLMSRPASRDQVSVMLAIGAHEIGWVDRAVALVTAIDHIQCRVEALVALIQRTPWSQRTELLMQALRCGRLGLVMPVLVEHPEVVAALVQEAEKLS
ncbi:hypothetical protein [Actinokineospora terrae]|nr:hypothetical protein [Actinokineospora terrae]